MRKLFTFFAALAFTFFASPCFAATVSLPEVSSLWRLLLLPPVVWGMISGVCAKDGTVYYVSEDGNDTNPGTLAKPFKTQERLADVTRRTE